MPSKSTSSTSWHPLSVRGRWWYSMGWGRTRPHPLRHEGRSFAGLGAVNQRWATIWPCAPPRASGALLLAHHEHRAVGVPDNRLRNTAHQRPPYGAQTSATYHDRPCTYLLAQPHDLLIWISRLEVRLGHLPPGRPDLLGLLLKERTGFPLGLFEDRAHDLPGVEVMSPELPGRRKNVDDVHFRAGVLGELGGGLCGQTSLLGAVGGQQDLRRKYAHRGNLLTLRSFLEHHDAISRNSLHLCPTPRSEPTSGLEPLT